MNLDKRIKLLICSVSCSWSLVHSTDPNLRRKRFHNYDASVLENDKLVLSSTEINTKNNEAISKNSRTLQDATNNDHRELLNEYGAMPLHRAHLDSIIMEEIVSIMQTLDLSMSYIATPTMLPTQTTSLNPSLNPSVSPSVSSSVSPSVNCASPTAREKDIREYAESISSASKTTDPSTPQYEAIQWLLNTDSNTNACDGLTSISRRYGLAMLYFSTNGPSWTNSTGWLDTLASECAWHGISCNANGSFIEEINLAENKVTGSIPDEFFYSMPSLTNVSFYNNEVTGTLPVSIGSLTQLSLLDMEQNKLTGPLFTPELFNLKNTLSKLWVSFNEFEDEIPPTISQFNMLENLWAAGNKLYGTLPTEIGMLNSMTKLLIYNNTFSGTIPSEFGNLRSSLQWIDARNSSLIGTIPEELYELTKLEKLILSKNSLSGTVSSKLSSLVVLEQLFLNDNMFSGLLPDLTGASRMKNLDVKNNNFSGVLPDVSLWSALKSIDVSNNELFGTVPPSFFDNKLKLELAYFSNNSFVGTIPSNYFSPPKLRDLYFDGNMLTGQIPSPALDGLESMEELLFQNNDLIGIMPDDLCTIKTSNNSTFLNLFADCFPDPNNGNSVQLSCPIGCCNKCFI